MPCERFTCILVVGIVCAVVDCKIEGVNVGAGRAWLGMVVGVDAAFCIILAVPVVGVAGCDVIGCIVMVADGQVQSICAGTVVCVGIVVYIGACLGIGAVVPSIVFAGVLVVCIVCAVVDCKIEGVDVCAGRAWLGMVVSVDAAFQIIMAVPVVGFAGCDVVGGIFMIAYCQMHGVCAGTDVSVEVVVCVCTSLGICTVVPSIVFAGILVVCIVCAVVDCKV